jgi:Ca2+-binding RTX toxin-like protein
VRRPADRRFPSVASAASFSRDYLSGSYVLRYTAAAGEANALTLTRTGTAYVANDPGASLTPGTACTALDSHTVSCPDRTSADPPSDFPIIRIEVTLGDQSDTANVTAPCEWVPFGARCRELAGGAGDDVLTGGADGDRFVEGVSSDGNDTFIGGGGDDLVDYSAASVSVDVTLDGVANDGPAGQLDNVPVGVAVAGGEANDTLTGSESSDRLDGGGGSDAISGLGDADSLRATGPSDTVEGGTGNDDLVAEYTSGAILRGGPDDDKLTATLNAGTAEANGGSGDDELIGPGVLEGGEGKDILRAYGAGTLSGGVGDDLLIDAESAGIPQVLAGDGGTDTVRYFRANDGVTVSLDGTANDGSPPICQVCAPEADNVGPDGDVERVIGTINADILTGGPGNDVLQGWLGPDVLDGGSGSDSVAYDDHEQGVIVTLDGIANDPLGDVIGTDVEGIVGGPGNDTLVGDSQANTLSGGGGDDRLEGQAGSDALIGGDGRDLADYAERAAGVQVSANGLPESGNAEDGPPGARDSVATDVEDLTGGSGDDVLTGNAERNVLDGGLGDDDLHGLGGVDVVDYSGRIAAVFVDLGDPAPIDGAEDEFDDVGADVEDVLGGAGADLLIGSSVSNVLEGGGGDDLLDGAGSADALRGGTGLDLAYYGTRSAAIVADLDGQSGDDGEAGEDDTLATDLEGLVGGAGNDTLTGGSSDDLLDGGTGADELRGGGGYDGVSYEERTAGVTADADGVAGDDGQPGEGDTIADDVEDLYGGAGDDVLVGNSLDNFLFGGTGADRLDGGNGEDALFGEAGGDDLTTSDANADLADCGLGDDLVRPDALDELLDCERQPEVAQPTPPATTSPDRAAPKVRIRVPKQPLSRVRRRGLLVRISCSEPCTLAVRLQVAARTAHRLGLTRRVLGEVRGRIVTGAKTLVLRLAPKARRSLGGTRSLRGTLRVVAKDPAGNRRVVRTALELRQ